jgi:hypothetical protein
MHLIIQKKHLLERKSSYLNKRNCMGKLKMQFLPLCAHTVTRFIRQIKSRRMRWAGHVARMGEGRNVYRVLVGKPEGKRPLGRPWRRWEDGIKMGLTEIVGGVWSGFTWLRIGTVGGLL